MSNQKGYIDSIIPPVMIVLIVVGLSLVIYASILEKKEWEVFKVEHECEIVSREKATTGTGVGMMANGNVGVITTTTPSKTGWLCNDGIIYIR
ncbi:MAG: hypothetical protein PVI03_01555 [Candidatus Thorarchaeota archaeon]|jgi:hypothetical protein